MVGGDGRRLVGGRRPVEELWSGEMVAEAPIPCESGDQTTPEGEDTKDEGEGRLPNLGREGEEV